MKRRVLAILILALMMLNLFSLPTKAQQLQARELPSNTQWLAHVKWERFLRSPFGKALMKKPQLQALQASTKQQYGLDMTQDIMAITVVGVDYTPKDTVLQFKIRVDPNIIIAKVKRFPNYETYHVDTQKLHSWTVKVKKTNPDSGKSELQDERQYMAIKADDMTDDSLMLIGRGSGQLLRCLDVLNGTQRSLASVKEAKPLLQGTNQALITLVSRDLSKLFKGSARSNLFSKAQSFRLLVHEKNEEVTLNLDLSFAEEDDAKSALNIVKGVIAVMDLKEPKDEAEAQARKLVKDIDFTLVDAKISMELKAPSVALAQNMEKIMAIVQSGAKQLNQPEKENPEK